MSNPKLGSNYHTVEIMPQGLNNPKPTLNFHAVEIMSEG